ncbi:MAG: hypothetical protein QM770_05385 [Tepidisphaeraceae bacterium]
MQPETTVAPIDPHQSEPAKQLLMEMTVAALETMAFFCAEPAQPDAPWPDDAVQIRMSFKGHVSGKVTLTAGRFFGQRLASNALGCGVQDEEAVERAQDSLQELLNVTVGMMMPRFARSDADIFDLGLPQTTPFDGAIGWAGLAASPGTAVIDAEGDTIALHIEAF